MMGKEFFEHTISDFQREPTRRHLPYLPFSEVSCGPWQGAGIYSVPGYFRERKGTGNLDRERSPGNRGKHQSKVQCQSGWTEVWPGRTFGSYHMELVPPPGILTHSFSGQKGLRRGSRELMGHRVCMRRGAAKHFAQGRQTLSQLSPTCTGFAERDNDQWESLKTVLRPRSMPRPKILSAAAPVLQFPQQDFFLSSILK